MSRRTLHKRSVFIYEGYFTFREMEYIIKKTTFRKTVGGFFTLFRGIYRFC